MLMHRRIPFFDYPALFAELEQEVMTTVRDVFARGAYIMQSDLLEFERELAAYVGVKHAIGVADGTVGLLLPLLAMELRNSVENGERQHWRQQPASHESLPRFPTSEFPTPPSAPSSLAEVPRRDQHANDSSSVLLHSFSRYLDYRCTSICQRAG